MTMENDLVAVAWAHPTAGWARSKYHSVLVHCHKAGPGPVALVSKSEADSRIQSLEAELARKTEALTPSGATKAAYIGEFQFSVTMLEIDESHEPYECQRMVTVPWTTVKEIMAAILARSALEEKTDA